MPTICDGPRSPRFSPLLLPTGTPPQELAAAGVSELMAQRASQAPSGSCTAWGLPFEIGAPLLLKQRPLRVEVAPTMARWLIFMHTGDVTAPLSDADALKPIHQRLGQPGEHLADYVVCYADGTEQRLPIRLRHQVGLVSRGWGANSSKAVGHAKPRTHICTPDAQIRLDAWGHLQTRTTAADGDPWMNWLWAWENPEPRKLISALRFEPLSGTVLLFGISAGNTDTSPLRWQTRHKAILTLPEGQTLQPNTDGAGLLPQIQLDLGQVISAQVRPLYPNDSWADSYNNQLPQRSEREVLVEYTAHEEALFHLPGGKTVPVAELEKQAQAAPLRVVTPATQRVTLRVVKKGAAKKPVAVKLHVHGEAGEYLAPVDRHRIPNPLWFQDYSVDFSHSRTHHTTYIDGETTIDLPIGRVYVEISKGFEIRPLRKVLNITPSTRHLTLQVEKVLPWREKGWVTADTHVHFLSPSSALLEGAAEGVNVVNLLASQWGELMTNVGDFDGKTTLGSKDAGGDGEHLVRVGTENRQHILGHISLLGYGGRIIAPMTTGGADESALGDPVGSLMMQWARQCHKQRGVVILPHFPSPRSEHAACIVAGDVDGVEMTSWGSLYGGIDPYSLVDWYRYLNCGYMTAAVGGTDKMSAETAVGTVRTYAHIDRNRPFTYDTWKQAIRRAETFVTYGPLMDFTVEGKAPGSRLKMPRTGGTVDVTWKLASVTVPMSRVELIVNGEVRESQTVDADADEGTWSVKLDRSSWLALLVRGHYADKPEIIAAHSSPVMVEVKGSPFFAAADATTILEQIEGALAYIDTVGTRADDKTYKQMRLLLTSAHRSLHNRMHQSGHYHQHSPLTHHPEHD